MKPSQIDRYMRSQGAFTEEKIFAVLRELLTEQETGLRLLFAHLFFNFFPAKLGNELNVHMNENKEFRSMCADYAARYLNDEEKKILEMPWHKTAPYPIWESSKAVWKELQETRNQETNIGTIGDFSYECGIGSEFFAFVPPTESMPLVAWNNTTPSFLYGSVDGTVWTSSPFFGEYCPSEQFFGGMVTQPPKKEIDNVHACEMCGGMACHGCGACGVESGLNPISGDGWLCAPCLDVYMGEPTNERSELIDRDEPTDDNTAQ